jgi:hypothetical protein
VGRPAPSPVTQAATMLACCPSANGALSDIRHHPGRIRRPVWRVGLIHEYELAPRGQVRVFGHYGQADHPRLHPSCREIEVLCGRVNPTPLHK